MNNPFDIFSDYLKSHSSDMTSDIFSIVKDAGSLAKPMKEDDNIVPDAVLKLVKDTTSLLKGNPAIGDAFWTLGSQEPDYNQKLVWILCSLMCMHPEAKNETCRHLGELGQEFKSVQEALRSNSLYALVSALARVDVEFYKYDVKLIIAFLVYYPYAYIAHYPQDRASLLFSLSTSLQNVLECDVISNDAVFTVDEVCITERMLAEMLFERLETYGLR